METIQKAKDRRVRRRRSATQHADRRVCPAGLGEWLDWTRDADPRVRSRAIGQACPCHVKANRPALWDRLIEMAGDADARVRGHVLHTLADGSPREREIEIVAAIESMRNDPDRRLRRRVRKLLASYRRSGNINVL